MSIFGVGRCGKSLKASPIPQMVWSALLQRPVTLTVLDLRACVNGYAVIPRAVGLLISPQKACNPLQKTPYLTSKPPLQLVFLSATKKTTMLIQQRLNTSTCTVPERKNLAH